MIAIALRVAVAAVTLAPFTVRAAEPILLHAAGSLRPALTEVAGAFEAAGGSKVTARFGASGLLRDAIAGGEKAEVFASANMEHPLSLSHSGASGPVILFARNRLCALARPGLAVTSANVVERMLDPQLKLGTSTPRSDPSGDYAWEVFRKIDSSRPGSFAALEQKALQLVGGPTSPQAPPERSIYGLFIETGQTDLFLTYCTNAQVATKEVPGASVIPLPDEIAVGADYGLTVMKGAPEEALRLALFILSLDGQNTLARHGFTAPTLPEADKP